MKNIYFIADTHFGHNELVEKGFRPENFGNKLLKNLKRLNKDDILFHLGDFAVADANTVNYFCYMFKNIVKAKKYLIIGNHDKRSFWYYLEKCGFDGVFREIKISHSGQTLILSHLPVPASIGQINLHGHYHEAKNSIYEEVYGKKSSVKSNNINDYGENAYGIINSPLHFLISAEYSNYSPISINYLDQLIRRKDGILHNNQ